MKTKKFNVYSHDNKAVRDAYSMLTTNIKLGSEKKEIKTIVITSCTPKTGKTSLAINLATTMAGWGKKILLVDTDMRKPAEAKRLSEEANWGVSDYLQGLVSLEEAIHDTNVQNLEYLPSGKYNASPMEVLSSDKLEDLLTTAKSKYDFIVFDTPALASVADSSIIASKTDATLLVAKMNKTNLLTLKRAKDQLEKVNANILGVVLNKVKKSDYKKYFESYNYFFNEKKFIKSKKVKSNAPVAISN